MDIQVSLVASANRIKWWKGIYESLKGNKINWELIYVGNTPPDFELPKNFKWIKAYVKPAQCYEIGFREAKGELIHWTADDAFYTYQGKVDNLDTAYNFYKKFNDYKTIVAMRPFENGGDVWKFHHFFGGWGHTPMMAPFGFISKKLMDEIGGYDRRFISGQSENDLVMRALEAGGKVEICMNSIVHVRHSQIHPKRNLFRLHYNSDREFLENCWVQGGYGSYVDKNLGKKSVPISKTRLLPFEPFEDKESITRITQGPKGIWGSKEKWEAIENFVKENNYERILELGVGTAETTERVLKSCDKLMRYYLVDPYYDKPEIPERLQKVLDSNNNATFFRQSSKEAIVEIEDRSLGLVCINANHLYEHVKEDIALWFPKLKRGGIICGHDYDVPSWEGVKRAVDEAFENVNVIVDTDKEGSNNIWWYKKEN